LKEIGTGTEVHEMHPQKVMASIQELRERAGKK
jgi:hypothetical protein